MPRVRADKCEFDKDLASCQTIFAHLIRYLSSLILILAFSSGVPALAGIEQLPEAEFRTLIGDLAPKVILFHDAWEVDPKAEFFGGTTRDFIYWIKGHFKDAKTPAEASSIAEELRALKFIAVSDFIVGDSDADAVSDKKLELNAENYGIRKIDHISRDTFNPETDLGKTELWQGYVPVEKIRIGKSGLISSPGFGDGVHEIYAGKLTFQTPDPEKFSETKYAKAGENHPVLLALRYLRVQAINYFQTYGKGIPDKQLLEKGFDAHSAAEARRIISRTLDGHELVPFLQSDRFKTWINATIQKMFRSYTNPNAALAIAKEYGVDLLSSVYGPDKIETINKYVFEMYRDHKAIAGNFTKYGLTPEMLLVPRQVAFPDGFFYHCTRTLRDFRLIMLQGILPSVRRNAGDGLYGVNSPFLRAAEAWTGESDLMIRFPVKEDARIADVTTEPGLSLLKKFNYNFEKLADAFGLDLIYFEWDGSRAFVNKNSVALGNPEGVHRSVVPFTQSLEEAARTQNPSDFIKQVLSHGYTEREIKILLTVTPFKERDLLEAYHQELRSEAPIAPLLESLTQTELWIPDPALAAEMIGKLHDKKQFGESLDYFLRRKDLEKYPEIVEAFVANPMTVQIEGGPSEIFERKPWNTMPSVVRKVMEITRNEEKEYKPIGRYIYTARFFEAPVWAAHPEVFFEFVARTPEAFVRPLLNLPHWANHPALQFARIGNSINYTKLKAHALRLYPNAQGLWGRIYAACAEAIVHTRNSRPSPAAP